MTISNLTDRQKEIVRLVAHGYSNADIAEALCIVLDTVKRHLSLIFVEIGIKSRMQLTIWALKEGLVQLEDLQHDGLPHSQEKDNRATYQIEVTSEQMILIHRLLSSTRQRWILHRTSEYLDENGDVQQKPLKQCRFCQRGSYSNASSIKHHEQCFISVINREWNLLYEQFSKVLGKEIEEDLI